MTKVICWNALFHEQATMVSDIHPVNARNRPKLGQSFRADARQAWQDYQATGLHVSATEAEQWLLALEAGRDVDPPECHD